jgi:hypothetical protein
VSEELKDELHYLTPEDFATLHPESIDLQVALGLQSCKTLGDVEELLQDIRLHERVKTVKAVKEAISEGRVSSLEGLDRFLAEFAPSISIRQRTLFQRVAWASCKTRLPEDDLAALVACTHGAIVIAYWHRSDRHWEITREDRQLHFTGDDPVTHWMKLPSPPEKEEVNRYGKQRLDKR